MDWPSRPERDQLFFPARRIPHCNINVGTRFGARILWRQPVSQCPVLRRNRKPPAPLLNAEGAEHRQTSDQSKGVNTTGAYVGQLPWHTNTSNKICGTFLRKTCKMHISQQRSGQRTAHNNKQSNHCKHTSASEDLPSYLPFHGCPPLWMWPSRPGVTSTHNVLVLRSL